MALLKRPQWWRQLSVGVLLAVVALHPNQIYGQQLVPRIGGICPFGYVDAFKDSCSNLGLTGDRLAPAKANSCPQGWLYVGGGYCRQTGHPVSGPAK